MLSELARESGGSSAGRGAGAAETVSPQIALTDAQKVIVRQAIMNGAVNHLLFICVCICVCMSFCLRIYNLIFFLWWWLLLLLLLLLLL